MADFIIYVHLKRIIFFETPKSEPRFLLNSSIWTWHNDLQRSWVGNFFRDSLELSLLPSPQRNQSYPPDGLHLQPDVLRLHERSGEKDFLNKLMLILKNLWYETRYNVSIQSVSRIWPSLIYQWWFGFRLKSFQYCPSCL